MFSKKIFIYSTLLLLFFVNLTFGQKNISSMLSELVGEYSTSKDGAYIFTVTESGTTVKFILNQFDYSDGKGLYCWYIITPVHVFNKNFRPSEELLHKIASLNVDLNPGSLSLSDNLLYYSSYFWDEELSQKVLGYEIVSGYLNTAKMQREIENFLSGQ